MNYEELKVLLANRKGACPVSIYTETIPDLKGGKSCELLQEGEVKKIAVINCIINWLYEGSVNRQRQRENNAELFNAEPRKWGARLHLKSNPSRLLPFVHHVSGLVQPSHRIITSLDNLPPAKELYLETKVERPVMQQFVQCGTILPNEIVQQYLRDRIEGKRQQVKKPVVLRDYALTSIKKITLDHQVYVLTDD